MTAVLEIPPLADYEVQEFRTLCTRVGDAVEEAVYGKRNIVDLVLVAMFAGGHVLIEDVPGTGKTTLARALSLAFGGVCRRIQFTPDLLPSDVTGTSVYDPQTGEIRFRPGPIFANVVVADEINRAAAKTQSALLEVMQERTVTVDGRAYSVPETFLVIATQNPVDLEGTYRLPEAQLDRFSIKTPVGYPEPLDEVDVLRPNEPAGIVERVSTVTTPDDIAHFSAQLRRVHVAESLLAYVQAIGAVTRADSRLRLGISTRGLRSLVRCAQALAAAQGRNYVVPGDLHRLMEPVLAHRLCVTREAQLSGVTASNLLAEAIASVELPRPVSERQ